MKRQLCCSSCWLIAGALIAIAGLIILLFIPFIFHKSLEIKEGSLQYESVWVNPEVPIYMQWYIFNLTNADDVAHGVAKPKLVQLGPYTYREHRIKKNITWNENNTVTYNNLIYWTFIPEKSNGTENDTIITVNLPLVTVANSFVYEAELLQILFGGFAKLFGEPLFKSYQMHELIWGYHDPMMSLAHKKFPDWFYTDWVGIYAGKNYTNDGTWTVHTGVDDMNLVGQTSLYNGSKYLNWWSTEYGNMVNGTDGSVSHPGVNKSSILHMFIPDVCRSLYAEYAADESTPKNNIPLYRFSSPALELANSSVNPDNSAWCTPAGNCLGAGVINLTSCHMLDSFNVPVIASLPHFLYAEDKYLKAVEGLNPDPVEHRTDIAVEPRTGLVMRIAKRLQINIYLEPIKFITQMSNLANPIVLPVVWLNESALINDKLEDKFSSMMSLMDVGKIGGWVSVGVGAGTVVLSTGFLIYFLRIKKKRSGYTPLET